MTIFDFMLWLAYLLTHLYEGTVRRLTPFAGLYSKYYYQETLCHIMKHRYYYYYYWYMLPKYDYQSFKYITFEIYVIP